MSDTLTQLLASSTQGALETVAFMFATPPEDAPPADPAAPAPEMARATVAFEGPRNGFVVLRVPAHLVPQIATNALGADDTPSAAEQRDVLGELANIVCGNVLPSVSESAWFRLKPPVVVLRDLTSEGPRGELAASATLFVEADPIEVRLVLGEHIASQSGGA
jgi:hypothetical protein